MKYGQKQPCKECPFRKKCMPGWLGGDTGNAHALALRVAGLMEIQPGVVIGCEPEYYACHMDTARIAKRAGYGRDESVELSNKLAARVNHCAGALIYLRKQCKRPRDPEKAKAVKAAIESEPVLSSVTEFVAHHTKFNRKK